MSAVLVARSKSEEHGFHADLLLATVLPALIGINHAILNRHCQTRSHEPKPLLADKPLSITESTLTTRPRDTSMTPWSLICTTRGGRTTCWDCSSTLASSGPILNEDHLLCRFPRFPAGC